MGKGLTHTQPINSKMSRHRNTEGKATCWIEGNFTYWHKTLLFHWNQYFKNTAGWPPWAFSISLTNPVSPLSSAPCPRPGLPHSHTFPPTSFRAPSLLWIFLFTLKSYPWRKNVQICSQDKWKASNAKVRERFQWYEVTSFIHSSIHKSPFCGRPSTRP